MIFLAGIDGFGWELHEYNQIRMKLSLVLLVGVLNGTVGPVAAEPAGAYHQSQVLKIGGATIDVQISPEAPPVPLDSVMKWVSDAARALTAYYGRYPVQKVKIEIFTGGPGRIGHGVSYFGRSIKIHLGRATREDDLKDDWELTHEMVHLSFPQLDDS